MIIPKKQLGFTLPIAILIVIVLIAAGGAGYYFYKSPKGLTKEAEKIEQQLDECFTEMRTKPTKETQEKCQSAQAKFKDFTKDLKDPQICEQFEQQFGTRNSCLSSVAKNLKDPSICEKISPKGPKFPGPQSDCYTGVAVALKDYSICRKIISPASPELTSSCYTEVAVALGDPSGCEKISEAMSVYEISFEERIVWVEDACYRKLALNLGDFSLCEKIKTEGPVTGKQGCYQELIGKIKIKDPSICKGVQDYAIKTQCYNSVIEEAENVDICEEIEPDFRDECYWRFVSIRGIRDESLCQKIQDPIINDRCRLDLRHNSIPTLGYYDASFCQGLQTQKIKDECYKRLACDLLRGQVFCQEIKDSITKDECYKTYAWMTADVSACGKIKEQFMKDNCYFILAAGRSSSPLESQQERQELCQYIQDKNLKQQCEGLFEEP